MTQEFEGLDFKGFNQNEPIYSRNRHILNVQPNVKFRPYIAVQMCKAGKMKFSQYWDDIAQQNPLSKSSLETLGYTWDVIGNADGYILYKENGFSWMLKEDFEKKYRQLTHHEGELF
jgi:hypothetical protein